MKIFFLLILMSCGKENKFQDMQFLVTSPEIEGSLEFTREKSILSFRSSKGTQEEFYKDVIRTSESLHKKSEYQVIELDQFDIPLGDQFELKFKSNYQYQLFYIEGKHLKALNAEGFTISKIDLQKILSKKSFLAFQVPERSSLKKVMVLDDSEIKEYFVHKEDPRIPIEAKNISLETIFHGNDTIAKWYKKETPEGNILIFNNDTVFLREFFLKHSSKEKKSLSRVDGNPSGHLPLNEGMHYYKLIPTKTINVTNYVVIKEWHFERLITREVVSIVSTYQNYVEFNNVNDNLDHPLTSLVNFRKTEENTAKGTVWYVSFYIAKTDKISFITRPADTFFKEGDQKPRYGYTNRLRNLEAKFYLDIESYLEPKL